MSDEQAATFDEWAVLEIMGHDRYAGKVSEHTIGGTTFVRVDVPKVGDREGFTKLFGGSAIFSITPVSETFARAAAERFRAQPMNVYMPDFQTSLTFAGDVDDAESLHDC